MCIYVCSMCVHVACGYDVYMCICVHECGSRMYGVYVCSMFGVLCVNVYMCRVCVGYMYTCEHACGHLCMWYIYVYIMSAVLCV